ncbi:Ldh family oxidoreductase [Paenibacillus sp. IB182496]|uniref:Ldh family oxidoreductase n=1 Tax=Paenibacillus sabuli TaxID=2772509 RepID=A0A927BT52_9BACL|nr:Ldh family oxidoreductase [Paenibacillus sabuli]MBD2846313.1 Ldh family oxidoreductase [Paenibacillus sabuli]
MTYRAETLTAFGQRALAAVGVPSGEALTIAETMVEADSRGIHSHGLMRLPIYVRRLQRDLIRRVARIEVREGGGDAAVAVIDGHGSAGQLVATRAMALAIELAERHGIGAVLATRSNHFGIAGRYAQMAAQRHMIGLALSNTAPLMPPVGGAEKVLGNNPLAIAAPSGGPYPLLLDMAMSGAALGKILYAEAQGQPIPEGWGADRDGRPTTDPGEVARGGFILPVGGPKGFGLALMIELLTGVLAGGQFAKRIPSMYNLEQGQEISHWMLAIDAARFGDAEQFVRHAAQLAEDVKHARKADGVLELYLPGEPEFRLAAERLAHGIPLDAQVAAELDALAAELGVPLLSAE